MTTQKAAPPPAPSRRHCGERLKDEVYRQMFRLESHQPGAGSDLAIALLRVFVASDSQSDNRNERRWLKKICPICLAMIDDARKAEDLGPQRTC